VSYSSYTNGKGQQSWRNVQDMGAVDGEVDGRGVDVLIRVAEEAGCLSVNFFSD
jgi:hypothetical protein